MSLELIIFFYRWRNSDIESFNDDTKITWQIGDRVGHELVFCVHIKFCFYNNHTTGYKAEFTVIVKPGDI